MAACCRMAKVAVRPLGVIRCRRLARPKADAHLTFDMGRRKGAKRRLARPLDGAFGLHVEEMQSKPNVDLCLRSGRFGTEVTRRHGIGPAVPRDTFAPVARRRSGG